MKKKINEDSQSLPNIPVSYEILFIDYSLYNLTGY